MLFCCFVCDIMIRCRALLCPLLQVVSLLRDVRVWCGRCSAGQLMSPPAQVPTTGELGGGSHHHQPRWSELVPDTQPPADCSRVNISNTENLLFVQNIEVKWFPRTVELFEKRGHQY